VCVCVCVCVCVYVRNENTKLRAWVRTKFINYKNSKVQIVSAK